MWIPKFLELLAEEIEANDVFMGYKQLNFADPGGESTVRVFFTAAAPEQGRLILRYRYPQDYILMQADLYVDGRVVESYVKRFPLSRGILVAHRLGGSGSGLVRKLAKDVADWAAYVQE